MELSRDGMVDKLFADMYFGNGKPAVTVRLEHVETGQLATEKRIANIEKLLIKGFWLLLGTFAAVVGEIVIKVVMK